MSVHERLRVPIGTAPGWSTRPGSRKVLVVVHTVTTVTRLLDLLPLLESDPRVQLVFTRARTSNFREGVTEFLSDLGVTVAPWEQAVEEEFDLAIAASYGDDLHRIKAPVITFSHGAGYNKLEKPETGNRKPETGNRKPETGNRKPETGNRKPETVFGLSPGTLSREGTLVPQTLVLSHDEQLDRLADSYPDAVHSAVVAGDPTYDRILAGAPWRERYRDHLETGERSLILVSSTWGPTSLLGAHPEILTRLLAEAPTDEYRIALALHPNVWHGHGTWQIRSWLAEAERAGLRVLPDRQGWQAALVAADHIVGDHGSVTFYGAALGTHTVLGTFPHHEMATGSPIADFGHAATRLDPGLPLLPQITADSALHHPRRFADTTDLLTSVPGEAGRITRSLFYKLLDLPEPVQDVRITPPEPPVPFRRGWPDTADTTPLMATAEIEDGGVRVARHPAELVVGPGAGLPRAHVISHTDEPQPRWREATDIVVCGPDEGLPWPRLAQALAEHPRARFAVEAEGGACLVRARDGEQVRLVPGEEHRCDPVALASAYWRLAEGEDGIGSDDGARGSRFTVRLGERSVEVGAVPASAE